MKPLIACGLALLALTLAGCGGDESTGANAAAPLKLEQIQAPNGDWTQVVAETPEGGFRMGNPEAPVKLVEYASLSCPHCAEFAELGGPRLRDQYVKSGQVSWEFRPFMLFGSDPGVSMLLRCQGPAPFFRLADQLYVAQREWGAKLQALSPEQASQLEGMAPLPRAAALVRVMGLDEFFRQRGMPAAKIEACLSDEQGLRKLAEITDRGTRDGVTGTPTFFINGSKVEDAASWEALEPRLRAAIR